MNLDEVFKKVVFLLGAGASRDAGCLLSTGMLESLKTAINNLSTTDKEYGKYKTDFSEIYSFIFASLSYQSKMRDASFNMEAYINIEDFVMLLRQLIDKEFVIPYPLIGNWNDKILKWELKNGDVFNKFKDFITLKLVKEWTQFNQEKAQDVLKPIREMLSVSEDFKMNIFSLNYDLIFESIFNTLTTKILDTGFVEKSISGKTISYWAADFNNDNSPSKINLYKLHGSVDWEYNEETEEISIKENIDDDREPLIIFGSHSKMLSFDPFLYVLGEFRNLLAQATLFVVIGYSFHDKYINNLLIQQLSQNTNEDIPKKLLIVNPSWKDKSEVEVAEELKNIQDSKSINDIINFKQISPNRIKIISKSTPKFYKEYFSNSAQKLKDEIEQAETGEILFK
jgi:hypothetical protein